MLKKSVFIGFHRIIAVQKTVLEGTLAFMRDKNNDADIYSLIMICSTILASLSIGLVVALPESKLIWIVPIILFLPAVWSSFVLEKFKRNNDLKTYKEILAFSQNKDVEMLRERRNHRKIRIEKGIIVQKKECVNYN
ncbi:hypothetical protein ACMZ6Y_08775 [Streptococcus pluranimalium]